MDFNQYCDAIEEITRKYCDNNPGQDVSLVIEDDGLHITIIDKKTLRHNWVCDKLREMEEFTLNNYQILVDDPDRKIMVVNFSDELGDIYPGVARCSPQDTYNHNVGLAVAFAQAMEEDIPDFI